MNLGTNMETKILENGAIEAKLDISKATDNEIKKLVFMVASNITVVIKQAEIKPEDLIRIATLYGIVNYVPLWCVHKEYSEIVRVTNQIINDKGQAGLFSRGELNWHCNGMTAKEPEEVVLFYGKEMPRNGNQTIYSNGQKVWSLLSSQEQLDLIGSKLYRTNQKGNGGRIFSDTVVHNAWSKEEVQDLDKVSNRNKFNLPYTQAGRKREFTNHLAFPHSISGKMGIYFPYLMSSGINVPGYSDQQNEDMFYKLVELFNDERVIYYHDWDDGDIILNDQTQGLHKRSGDDVLVKREIWRIVFWYNFEQTKVDPRIAYFSPDDINEDGFVYDKNDKPYWIPDERNSRKSTGFDPNELDFNK